MSDKSRLENNNLELMNIYNAVENLPNAGGGGGDVKLYDTIANMNLDHNVDDGQLAIVYSNVSANITADTEFQVGTFPETVVLPEAMEGEDDYVRLVFSPIDEEFDGSGSGDLTEDSFGIGWYSSVSDIWIEYKSTDGKTYNRVKFTKTNNESGEVVDIIGDKMDFGTVIKFGSPWEELEWDDRIGYFIQVGDVSFNGLYAYSNNNYILAKTQLTSKEDFVYMSSFYGVNGVGVGKLQLNTNLNTFQVRLRQNVKNSLQMLGVSDASNLFFDFDDYVQTNTSYFNTSDLDLSNINNTSNMFHNCKRITDCIELNTINVTNMSHMFVNCECLNFSVMYNVANFDTSNVINMNNMFYNCRNLTSVPNFNIGNVTDIGFMFYGCYNLTSVPNFDTSNVTTMVQTFNGCNHLTSIPNFNTSSMENLYHAFYYCSLLVTIPEFNTRNVTDMSSAFSWCNNLSNTSVQNIINMCLNSNVTTYKNLSNKNSHSPFYLSNITSSRYSNRLSELTAAGWSY